MPGRFREAKLHGGPWKPQQGAWVSFVKGHEKTGDLEGSLGDSTEPQEEVLMSLSVWSCRWVSASFWRIIWGVRDSPGVDPNRP